MYWVRTSKRLVLRTQLIVLLAMALFGSANGQDGEKSRKTYNSSWSSLEQYRCPDWFRDAKFGIWSSWNAYTVPAVGDWYARSMYIEGSDQYRYHLEHYGHPSQFGYKDIVDLWKADRFSPDSLISFFKENGARYFVAMAVHHDNFDLWDSKNHEWNSVNYGPQKNIIKIWQDAAITYELPFGISSHLERTWNWFQTAHGSDSSGIYKGVPYDGANPEYSHIYPPKYGIDDTNPAYAREFPQQWIDNYTLRIKDLLTQHKPDFFYVDGGIPFGVQGRQLVAWFYNSYRNWKNADSDPVMTFKNFGHTDFHGDFRFGTCVEDIERGRMAGISPVPWQTDDSIGDWFWTKNDQYISPRQFIHSLIDIVSKNGNLLMNIPLKADGTMDEEAKMLIMEVGKWLKINGEGIYGTRPFTIYGEGPTVVTGGFFSPKAILTVDDSRFTSKGDTVFAFVCGNPVGEITIKAFRDGFYHRIQTVEMLGSAGPLPFRQEKDGLKITVPERKTSDYAVCLRIVPRIIYE
jgi:alpha-L-fucosidase